MPIGSIMNTSTLTLTFDDEFNSFVSSPDGSTGLWQTSMGNGNRTLGSNGEQEYYSDSSVGYNPFSDQNGILSITAEPTSVTGANALGLPYDSGVITTESSFNQLYGYFEINAELPAGQGLWPAFWLLPASGAWPPELDVFEVLGNNPSTLYFSTHSSVEATDGTTLNVANTSTGFHTYGVMWGPQTVDLYIDNVEVASMPTPADMNVPMYMLANLAVGGYWPGDPNSSTLFPATMQINYIRAYAYPGTTGGTVYDTLPSQNIGAAATPATITAPGSVIAAIGVTSSLGNISVAANWPGGDFTVMVSDYSGLLETSPTADVFTSGEDTTGLRLTGNLPAINAALKTLSYHGTATGDDWLWIGVTNPQGQQSTASVVADVGTSATAVTNAGPVVTTPAGQNIAANGTLAIPGLSVADGQAVGNVTVLVSDVTGTLTTATEVGVTATGEGSNALTLVGSLDAINADLVSLTYKASAAAGTDTVSVALTDAAGNQAIGSLAVNVLSGGVVDTPVVTTAGNATVTSGSSLALTGLNIADSQASGNLTLVVSDGTGLLSAAAVSGVAESGAGTTALTLSGSLTAINAALANLTYQAGPDSGTDVVSFAATTADGAQGSGSETIVVTSPTVTTTPVVTTPANASVAAGASVAVAGVSVTDSQPGGTFTVTVSDSNGLLSASPTTGVTATGEGTTALTLSGNLVAINADLASLTYQATQATGTDWLWVSAQGTTGGQGVSPVVMTITAPTVPVAPVVTAPTSFTVAAGTSQALSGFSVTDSGASGGVTVTLTDSTGLLSTTASSGVTATGEGTTALSLTGSLAAINTELATLTYQAGASAGSDTLNVSATAANGDDDPSVPITVTAAAATTTPVVTVPATATIAAGTTQSLSGVSVADDQTTGTFTATVSDSYGVLDATATGGVTATGEGTTFLTLSGSLAAINADLATLTYQAGASTGSDWLWVSASGTGGSQGLNHTVVSVTTPPVIAPTVTPPASASVVTGATQALSGVSIADTQTSSSFTVSVKDASGLLDTTATAGVTATGEGTTALSLTGSLAAINTELATLTYQAAASSGSDTVSVTANAANGPQASASATVTVTAPVIVTPVVTTPATASATAGASRALSGVSIADSQAGATLSVTVSDSSGLLTTAAATGVTQVGEGTTALALTGSLAAINADLATLSYQAAASAGSDWVWVSASSSNSPQAMGHTVVTVAAPPPVVAPVVTTPTSVSLPADSTHALSGVSVADSQAGGTFNVTVSDVTGLLSTTPTNGVTATGEDSNALTLSGNLAAINADLVSLTYQAGNNAGSDWVWVSATGASGPQGLGHTVVTTTPIATVNAPASLSVAAGTTGTLPGVSVADSASSGTFSVTVSDSTGLLHTATASGVTQAGEGTTGLTLTGSLAAINADLASLSYTAGQTAGSDWLWISANDANGGQGVNHTVVTATAAAPAIAGLETGSGTTVQTGTASIGATLDLDGGHVLENLGSLVWNGGTIALGSGDSTTATQTGTLDNAAGGVFTIEADGSVNSASSTGTGSIINAGTLLKAGGSGDTTVYAPLVNSGTVEVSSGTLTLEKAVSGSGTFQLAGLASLDFAAVVGTGSTLQFLQPGGTLEVQAPKAFGTSRLGPPTFGATILGFAAGDTIDSASVLPGVNTSLSYTQVGNSGTLAVTDGLHSALFNLQGIYAASNFHLAADGHGGTNITYS